MAISLAHKSITIDVNNRNAPNVVAIANVNDKAVRYLDVTLTASGEKLTFADCTVTATFATDGYLISDSVACTLNSTADVITVPLEDFKSMSGFLAIEIKIANGETQVLNTPLSLKVMVTPSLAENSKINSESAGTFVEISREVVTARGSHNSLGARLNTVDANLANKADKTRTLAGYGIVNAYTKTEMLNFLAKKEDNSNKVSSKTDITDSSTNYPSIKYLNDFYYDASEIYSSEETDKLLGNKADKAEVDSLLATKYDSSNIELGTATLTPYSTLIDKIKSATCLYEKIGDIVIVNVTVIMNATTLGGTSAISLLNMPFPNKSDVIVHDIGISKNGGMFRGNVNKSAWLQFTPLNKQAYNFVADEQVNFSLIYKI